MIIFVVITYPFLLLGTVLEEVDLLEKAFLLGTVLAEVDLLKEDFLLGTVLEEVDFLLGTVLAEGNASSAMVSS